MAEENILMSKKQYDIFMKRVNACNDHIDESSTGKDKAGQASVRKEESSPATHHNQDGNEDKGDIKNEKNAKSSDIGERSHTQNMPKSSSAEGAKGGGAVSTNVKKNKITKKDITAMLRPPGILKKKKKKKRRVWLTLA